MAKLARLYVEQEECGFYKQKAAGTRKHRVQREVDMPKVPDARRDEDQEHTERATEEQVPQNIGGVDAVVWLHGRRSCHEFPFEQRAMPQTELLRVSGNSIRGTSVICQAAT
jgi:hypothetical protein